MFRSVILFSCALLSACSPAALEPVQLEAGTVVDGRVRRLVDKHVALVRAAPASGTAHGSLGLVYQANELWEEAAASFANAAELEPDRGLWLYRQALCLDEVGEIDRARELLRDACARTNDEAAPYYDLGMSLLQDGAMQEASGSFQRAAALAPGNVLPEVAVAKVSIESGDYEHAEALLREALRVRPDYKHAHFLLGSALRGLGRMEEAQRELQIGADSQPEKMGDSLSAQMAGYAVNYVSLIDRASDLIGSGELIQAIKILEELREERGDDLRILNNLGSAYLEQQRFEEARDLLQQVLEADPDQFAAWINLSVCQRSLGNFKQALAAADRAVELAPKIGQAHFVRGEALLSLASYQEARMTLQRARRLDVDNARIEAALAEVSLVIGDASAAIEHYSACIQKDPTYLPAHVSLAALLMQNGRFEEADRALQKAEALAPGHPRVTRVREKLDGLR